jgi:methylmalonyl-CoA/ethylmalonyl-CoA epimerase
MSASIAVVGAGARASLVAERLAEAGVPATVVAGDDGAHPAAPADVVLFAVRPSETARAARRAGPLVGDHTFVVSIQEGIGGGGALAEAFGGERVLVAVMADRGPTLLGPHDGGAAIEGAERCAALLSAAGLAAQATPAIATEVWRRLVVTAAATPVEALFGASAGAGMRATMDEVALEVVRVARALGHDVDPAEGLRRLHNGGPVGADGLAEVDAINGAVVDAASGVGVDVPLNRAFLALVKEQGAVGAGRTGPLRRLDHVAVVVRDTDAALRHFRDTLGLRVAAVDEPPEIAVRLTYLDLGNAYLQLVEPLDGETAVARWLADRGEGLHHLCFEVGDLASALERLRPDGEAQPTLGSGRGRPTGFVAGEPPHGVPIELTPPEDGRLG